MPEKENKQLNLNLGCGHDTKPGYISIDIRPLPHVDLVADAKDLSEHFQSGTVDNIIAFELLEHYPLAEAKKMLAHWIDLLKPGGRLHLRVPDIEEAVRQRKRETLSLSEFNRYLYGAQEFELDYHKCALDVPAFREILTELGAEIEEIQEVAGTRMLYVDAAKKS